MISHQHHLGQGYNAGVALFGGTAPLVATALVETTGWRGAPGLYRSAAALLALILTWRCAPRSRDVGTLRTIRAR